MMLTRRLFLKLGAAAAASLSFPLSGRAGSRELSIPVLQYHDINFSGSDRMPPAVFSSQMEWLYGRGYHAMAFRDIPELTAENARRPVILTFDGGHISFMSFVFPLLVEYGFNANINISGSHVGGFVSGRDPRLSWDEYRTLAASGLVEVGCYISDVHSPQKDTPEPETAQMQSEIFAKELSKFQSLYVREMGRAATVLSWASTSYDSRSIETARQAGFRYLLGTDRRYFRPFEDMHEIPRIAPDRRQDLGQFQKLMERKA